MRGNRFYILIYILFISSYLCAQKYRPPEKISVENGLSSRQVNCITVGRHGFLWSGTKSGLNRYDGYRFKQFFALPPFPYSGISNILKIKSDSHGNLWILNEGGVSRMDNRTGQITHFPETSLDAVYKQEFNLIDIDPAGNGALWILSDRSLTCLSMGQIVNTYLIPENFLVSRRMPTCIKADPNGNIWIGTSEGLLLFNIQQKIFKEMAGATAPGLLTDNHVNCLYIDFENSLWVGTNNGMNRVDPVDFAFYGYYPSQSNHGLSNRINEISGFMNESMLIANESKLMRFNAANGVFEEIPLMDPAININDVAADSSGNIWLGTQEGLLKLSKMNLILRNMNSVNSVPRLAHESVTEIMPTEEKSLLIGYDQNKYSILNLNTYSINHFSTLDGSRVVGFYNYKPKEYLVVTQHDIEVFSTLTNSRRSLFDKYRFLNKGLVSESEIRCLFYSNNRVIWLGTSGGLQKILLDSATHKAIHTLTFQKQTINIGPVLDIQQDRSGNLWIGTTQGILFYNPAKGNYNRHTPYDVDRLNTENKTVAEILPDKENEYLIATSGGVFRFDTRSHNFTYLSDDPAVMNMIRAINIDYTGNIWVASETDLFHYIRSNNTLKKYDSKDGLTNDTYSAIASNPEYVFFGGKTGLSIVRLPLSDVPSRIPDIAITSIRYLENNANAEELYYQVADTITVEWTRKPLRIDFSVLDFSRPEMNLYRYSFGKSKRNSEWKYLGTQNNVVLYNLNPGKYRLNVTGSNRDLNWNSKGTSLIIIVEAPYWRSTIGMTLIIVAGLILVIMFIRFWIRQFFNLSKENEEREMFARQIMLQKEELTLKNKSITDSINYAKRIQTAMLPPYKLFKSIFPSSFILFMPKDIVSGDFYWVNKLGDRIFIAAVDCTGHGVPGAFMSIIGFELFRKITNIEGLSRPSDILNRLNEDFHEIFKDVDNVVLRDGMDVAFCSIDKKDMILEYAGAFNPLYLIRDNKIMEVKGDRFAIGLDETNFKDQTFKNHIIPIQKDDIIYIFSDGFSDQFGGPDGKKYKYRRFRHLLLNLHQLPMEKQHEILENNVMEWRGEQEQVDDILVIGIKVDFNGQA